MSTSESVTRSVTIVWKPARFAVEWAHGPDEVPPFDPSRGGDPFHRGVAYTFDVDGVDVHWTVREADLGGGAEPPPLRWHAGAEMDLSGDVVTVGGDNYPRLVRASDLDLQESTVIGGPLEDLVAIAAIHDSVAFMSAAKGLAGVFGLLSFDEADASLEGWRFVTSELSAHFSLVRQINEFAEPGIRVRDEDGEVEIDDADRGELLGLLSPINIELASPAKPWVVSAIESSSTVEGLRRELGRLYWEAFGHQLRPYSHRGSHYEKSRLAAPLLELLVDVGSPGQLVVRCGARGWALYELWRAITQVREIRVCEGCGRLFQPRRKDQRHCFKACRTKSWRKRPASA